MKRILMIIFLMLLLFYIVFPVFASQKSEIISDDISSTEFVTNSAQNSHREVDKIIGEFLFTFLIEFFAAGLGVLSALWVDKHSENKQYEQINQSLHAELLKIRDDLNERIGKGNYIYYRYLTPVWDINMAAGGLTLFTSIDKKNHKGRIDQKYINIYTKIQYAQELERDYIHWKLLEANDPTGKIKNDIIAIDNERNDIANEIFNLIVALEREVK